MINEKASGGASSREKPLSNTQQAVATLKELILSNQLASGSNHLESQLAERLGMSRTPVREATLILEAQGLVEVKPRHGVRVLPIFAEDMAEIYDILTELESLSAELAANRKIPEKEFTSAKHAIRNMDKALSQDNLEEWAAADEVFHSELVRLGGNNRISHIFQTYSDQVRRARKITLNLRPKPTKSNDDHRKVLEAIQNRKPKKARKLHREHRVQAKHMILSLLKQYGFHSI